MVMFVLLLIALVVGAVVIVSIGGIGIGLTVVGIMAISPEARQMVKTKYVQVKNMIRRKLEKRS